MTCLACSPIKSSGKSSTKAERSGQKAAPWLTEATGMRNSSRTTKGCRKWCSRLIVWINRAAYSTRWKSKEIGRSKIRLVKGLSLRQCSRLRRGNWRKVTSCSLYSRSMCRTTKKGKIWLYGQKKAPSQIRSPINQSTSKTRISMMLKLKNGGKNLLNA